MRIEVGTRNVKTASGYVKKKCTVQSCQVKVVPCDAAVLKQRKQTIELNHRLRQYKRRAKELLCSEKGLETQRAEMHRTGSRVRTN